MTQRVTIMMGIPGSGKTSWVREHRPKGVVCSADHWFTDDEGEYVFNRKELPKAHRECLLDYIANLDAGEDEIVIDNTNTSAVTISPYVALADAYGYTVNFVAMTSCHIDDCVERGLHAVPRAATENMARSLGKTITYWPAFWPKVQYA